MLVSDQGARRLLPGPGRFPKSTAYSQMLTPGIDGYEICESIKQNERFAGIPSCSCLVPSRSRKPRRATAGAKTNMTKPFESIRELFGRVLGGKTAGADTTEREYSTLGIDNPEGQLSTTGAEGQSGGLADEDSQADIEAQTADTRRLPQVDPEYLARRNGGASQSQVAHDEDTDEFGDAPLDLGDFRRTKAFAGDDPLRDILDETATSGSDTSAEDSSEPAAQVTVFEKGQDWSIATETVAVEVAQPESEAEESGPAANASPANLSDLSPEAVDAIARRVVARLSDKVVREIAWEVVPELAELLIKQKLEIQK
jgi:CheY-like chemotaxis protein